MAEIVQDDRKDDREAHAGATQGDASGEAAPHGRVTGHHMAPRADLESEGRPQDLEQKPKWMCESVVHDLRPLCASPLTAMATVARRPIMSNLGLRHRRLHVDRMEVSSALRAEERRFSRTFESVVSRLTYLPSLR
jgi:hypothetical protein